MKKDSKFKKYFNKIFLLLPMLFLLTGCGQGLSLQYPTTLGPFNIYTTLFYLTDWSFADRTFNINNAFAKTIVKAFNHADEFITTTMNFLSPYKDVIIAIIGIAQTLAIILVIVHFAKAIIKQYSNSERRGSVFKLIKSAFIAIFADFLAPGLMIACFVAATFGGVALKDMITENIGNSTSQTSFQEQLKMYDFLEDNNLTFATMCPTGQKDLGATDTLTTDKWFGDDEITVGRYDWVDPNYRNGKAYPDDPASLCFERLENGTGRYPLTIGEVFVEHYPDVVFIGKTTSTDEGGNSTLAWLTSVAYGVITWIMSIVFFFCIGKRVVDLIITIAMSWWYIGSSVSDDEGKSSIMDLFKKVLSISLSQLFLIFEYSLWVSAVLCNSEFTGTLKGIVMSYIWLKVLTGTPTVVEEMVSSTGTAAGVGGVTRSIFDGIRNGRK